MWGNDDPQAPSASPKTPTATASSSGTAVHAARTESPPTTKTTCGSSTTRQQNPQIHHLGRAPADHRHRRRSPSRERKDVQPPNRRRCQPRYRRRLHLPTATETPASTAWTPKATTIMSWGESGTDDGKVQPPPHIAILDDDLVIVCDRESHRVESSPPKANSSVNGLPTKLRQSKSQAKASTQRLHRRARPAPVQRGVANIGNRVSIFDWEGNMIDPLRQPPLRPAPDQSSGHTPLPSTPAAMLHRRSLIRRVGTPPNPPVDTR